MKCPKALLWLVLTAGGLSAGLGAEEFEFSRLILYDQRGRDAEETILIIDQHGPRVNVWLQNYLGQRSGEMPYAEYCLNFQAIRNAPSFALKPEYQRKLLRPHAARGTLTLAWKGPAGKEVKTIRYYAPEKTSDDFRTPFNRIWGLARYAIISPASLESPKTEYREDALYFLSGNGWLTLGEIDGVVAFHLQRGNGPRLTRAVWSALDMRCAAGSEFANADYRNYCVRKCLERLGPATVEYLERIIGSLEGKKRTLAEQILRKFAPKT